MPDITKIKVNGDPESSYQLYPRNEEFAKRGGGSGVQPDWNQNDNTKPDYVKNRPFYTGDPVENVIVEESTVAFVDNGKGLYTAQFQSTFEAIVGETYKVSWDGTVYECTCVLIEGLPAIGNTSIKGSGSDTGEPFLMGVDNGKRINILTTDTSASHTFSISGLVTEVVKIDEKYLPKGLIVNIVGEESTLGNTYLLFDKTDKEIYTAVNNGITVTLKFGGHNLQCDNAHDIIFWSIVPFTLGSNGITKLEVLCVSRSGMGWFFKRTYIEANALAQ